MSGFRVTLAVLAFLAIFSTTVYADEQITLTSPRNIRSLGGLPAAGGTIRDKAIYRSAMLTGLKESDAQVLRRLHLHTIIDLRGGVEKMVLGYDSKKLTGDIPLKMSVPVLAAMNANEEYYRDFVTAELNRKLIKRFFDTFAKADNYPILYHCAVGRDRTGILTALLLTMMGTPRDVIMKDYLASEKVREAWLAEVFHVVDQAGGIEKYLLANGITTEEQQAIRGNLLNATAMTPAPPQGPTANTTR